eukprot:NODE_9_length_64580_cov_1.431941.p28 type:complete len:306 gc:universal NODE_9_length_64580_cov_1.431941:21193-20276(-)
MFNDLLFRDFQEALTSMAVNDKFQIHSLTMIAQDYVDYHESIVKAFDQAFPTSVNTELVLLVLDSILKHVGGVYIKDIQPYVMKWLSHIKKGNLVPKVIKTWVELPKPKSGPLFSTIVNELNHFLANFEKSVILSSKILITLQDFKSITSKKPLQITDYINFYFKQIPNKCQQCGMRFVSDNSNRFENHMDTHFRSNRRKQEISAQVRRGWWPLINEWINPTTIDEVQQDEEAVQETIQEKPKETLYATAPNGRKDVSCFICKEKFDKIWSDDNDCWMLKNCILSETSEYAHPSCLNSTKKRKIK